MFFKSKNIIQIDSLDTGCRAYLNLYCYNPNVKQRFKFRLKNSWCKRLDDNHNVFTRTFLRNSLVCTSNEMASWGLQEQTFFRDISFPLQGKEEEEDDEDDISSSSSSSQVRFFLQQKQKIKETIVNNNKTLMLQTKSIKIRF